MTFSYSSCWREKGSPEAKVELREHCGVGSRVEADDWRWGEEVSSVPTPRQALLVDSFYLMFAWAFKVSGIHSVFRDEGPGSKGLICPRSYNREMAEARECRSAGWSSETGITHPRHCSEIRHTSSSLASAEYQPTEQLWASHLSSLSLSQLSYEIGIMPTLTGLHEPNIGDTCLKRTLVFFAHFYQPRRGNAPREFPPAQLCHINNTFSFPFKMLSHALS